MPLQQQKAVAAGQLRRWELDLDAMARCAAWSREDRQLLEDEAQQILGAFPTLIAILGQSLGERCYVEAAEPYPSPHASDVVVFDAGTRCVSSGRLVEAPKDSVVGFIGRIPALISNRPFEQSLLRRLDQLRAAGSASAERWSQALLEVGGQRYLAPRFALWFSRSWPHADPPVIVFGEYFPMLDIPAEHVYSADTYYRLCLYASWREQPAVQVLQNRVVPRLLIDLMVADLKALGRLDAALRRLDVSLYELYNMVGQRSATEAFRRVYEELLR